MTRQPWAWAKRAAGRTWTAAVLSTRALEDFATDRRYRQSAFCHCCGRVERVRLRPRVIPRKLRRLWGLDRRLTWAFIRKETSFCDGCGASLRARRLAQALIEAVPDAHGRSGLSSRSLAEWVETPEARGLRIAEINQIHGVHQWLSRLPGHSYSDYRPGASPGQIVGGVRHEDLCRLTYSDESFDLVLTSETLEHVPDLTAALRELRRVLKPGGLTLGTVPWRPDVPRTFARAVVDADGSVHHLAPRIAHPGGDWGYPVFSEIGQDWPSILESAGFAAAVLWGPATLDDVAQVFRATRIEVNS